jgi:hypothetical protein
MSFNIFRPGTSALCSETHFVYLYSVNSATRHTVAKPEQKLIQVINCLIFSRSNLIFDPNLIHLHPDVDRHDAHEVVGLEAADVVNGPSVHFILTFFFYYLLSILTISNK